MKIIFFEGNEIPLFGNFISKTNIFSNYLKRLQLQSSQPTTKKYKWSFHESQERMSAVVMTMALFRQNDDNGHFYSWSFLLDRGL